MSTPESKVNDPDYKCPAYLRMVADVELMRDVLGGTKTMRAKGETYLPRHLKEHVTKEYPARLKQSVFFNATKKTLKGFVGMVFKEDPRLKESVPDEIRNDWENLDLAGAHGDVFWKQVFEDAMADGHAFVLTDMAKPVPQGATRADELGRRPYCLRFTKDQAINWLSDVVDGKEILTQITFRDSVSQRDGRFGQKEVVRYRVIYLPVLDDGLDVNGVQVRAALYGPVAWELYHEEKDIAGVHYRLVDEGQTVLEQIPLAVVYGNRTGLLESEPPLLDLAYLNIDWYQQNSDYRTQLRKLVPFLKRVGMSVEDIKAYGEVAAASPGDLIDVPKDCDVAYVSHDPGGLEQARQAIVDNEQRMAISGLSILTQRADSNITATEKRMDQGERTSDLSTAARSCRDAMELTLGFMAQFRGIADRMGDAGSIELGVSEDTLVIDPQILSTLNDMIDKGRFFVEDLLAYMQGGVKAIDFEDLKTRIEQLEAEKEAEEKAREAMRENGELEDDPAEMEGQMPGMMNQNMGQNGQRQPMNGGAR